MFYLEKFIKTSKSKKLKLKIILWEIISIFFFRSKLSLLNYSSKSWIMKRFGATIGDNLVIKEMFILKVHGNSKLVIMYG